MRIVLDTSVLVSAVRSRNGASFALVQSIPSREFEICLSMSLYLEWQDVLTRKENLPPGRSRDDALEFLRYLAQEAHFQEIYFSWRPFLRDPNDDLLMELAFAANCQYIITHNIRDFRRSEELGVLAITPGKFINLLRGSHEYTKH